MKDKEEKNKIKEKKENHKITKETKKITKEKVNKKVKEIKKKYIVIEKYDEKEKQPITFVNMVYVFTICAVIGFFVEVGYVYLSCGVITSRGMTYGPYCSIYGFGGVILYLLFHDIKPKKINIPYTFVFSAIVMGTFELVSGLFLKHVFGIEMWNYDSHFLAILHYTTVPIMIGWGVLATTYVFLVQPIILKVISFIPKNITKRLAMIILFIYLTDLCFSMFNIYNNPEVLQKLVNPGS